MKRVLFIIALGLAITFTGNVPANAGYIANKKAEIQQAKFEKSCKKDIQAVFEKMNKYAGKYDINNLKTLYSKNFTDNDGYNKDVYFSLVEDTWENFPDITYNMKIKDIKLNGDYATVYTEESATATSDDYDRKILGEFSSKSNCIYHLQRFSKTWEITSEQVMEEISSLKYGDARYVNINIETPKLVAANQEYTATLKVDLPPENVVVATINQEKIINPAVKSEDSFMRLKEDQTLARIFTANSDNVNEYAIASIGITSLGADEEGKVRVYMNGLAFIMSRVNVIPKNNFAKVSEKKESKESKGVEVKDEQQVK